MDQRWFYEGHDEPRSAKVPRPKEVDQPLQTRTGALTQNGLFFKAAQAFKRQIRPPERVRVYEKLKQGIWSYNGIFHLVDSWRETDGVRTLVKFRLIAMEGDEDLSRPPVLKAHRRRVSDFGQGRSLEARWWSMCGLRR